MTLKKLPHARDRFQPKHLCTPNQKRAIAVAISIVIFDQTTYG